MAMEVAVEDSPKKVARQRRWAVCAAKVRSGAFSSLGGDSDSESDDGVGLDGSRFKLKVRTYDMPNVDVLLVVTRIGTVICKCSHLVGMYEVCLPCKMYSS